MIAPSPESVLADATLAVHASSRVRHGQTKDGVTWVASFVGTRATFRAEKMLRRELLTHDQCESLIAAASVSTVWELIEFARGVS